MSGPAARRGHLRTLGWGALALAVSGGPLAADEAPDWLAQAARAETRSLEPGAPGEVLVEAGHATVNERGIVETRLRWAVRVATREGRTHAVARLPYATDFDKVRELRAWLIAPNGEVRRLGKDETLDLAWVSNDVYNEHRVRLIDASSRAEIGSVFGFESVVEQRPLFNQLQWTFQSHLPARSSRFEVSLPPGWTLEAVVFNRPALPPVRTAAGYAWELHDLRYLAPEPLAPGLSSLAPRLAVSFAPPPPLAVDARSFASWQEVAQWTAEISDPRSEPDEGIGAKARELTLGVVDEYQRLAAIARFVQSVPYISIQVGLGRFQPHAAPQVLAKSYGDCKDKVALMRALLKAIGVAAYPVLVSSADRDDVRQEWPSPTQFDHVIVAVAVSDPAARAASHVVVKHPGLGTLLLFDPTDENTRLGDLPEGEQGGLGLLGVAASGGLIRLPIVPSSASRLERQARARLSAEGGLSVELQESSIGQAAVRERRLWRSQSRRDYATTIERWLAQDIPGVRSSRVEAADTPEGGFRLEVDFSADRYGQVMQNRLLAFRPALVARQDSFALRDSTRQHPVVLHERAAFTTARIQLPPGFAVDETPEPFSVEAPFGRYSLAIAVEADALIVERRYETRALTVPASEYSALRGFFQRVVEAEQAPVVLIRKE